MVVTVDEPIDGRPVVERRAPFQELGTDLAEEQRRGRPVAVVAVVSHLECLGDEHLQVDRAVAVDRLFQGGCEHPLHPAQPFDHLVAERPVAEHIAEPLVESCVGHTSTSGIPDHRHRHGRAHDARHGADGAVVMTRRQGQRRAHVRCLLGRVRDPFVQDRPDQRAAERAAAVVPCDGRPGVEEGPIGEGRDHVPGGQDIDQVWPDREHPLEGDPIGVEPLVGGEADQCLDRTGGRWSPIGACRAHALRLQRLCQQIDADRGHHRLDVQQSDEICHRAASTTRPAARPAAAALEMYTSAPASRRPRACRSRPWGS